MVGIVGLRLRQRHNYLAAATVNVDAAVARWRAAVRPRVLPSIRSVRGLEAEDNLP